MSTQVETRCLLHNYKYIKISGKDKAKFLQGLSSNDINLLKSHGDCIASVFLSSSGRIIVDALIYNVNNGINDPYFLIETHSNNVSVLKSYLNTYKLRSAVKIEDANIFGLLIHNKLKNKPPAHFLVQQ
jgi:folate-binding Fe-S cluster repair protein YgfZ